MQQQKTSAAPAWQNKFEALQEDADELEEPNIATANAQGGAEAELRVAVRRADARRPQTKVRFAKADA